MINSLRIVLVNTTHPGNIGGTARAMKNMGFTELYLVQPCEYQTQETYARASGAHDVVDNAKLCGSLAEALEGCTVVFGTSARTRAIEWEDCTVREAAESCQSETQLSQKVAVVFGQERAGLTNDELALCHRRVHIPTNPAFSSLNLAAAVQLICYEFRMSLKLDEAPKASAVKSTKEALAAADDMERFYTHLQATLVRTDFLDPQNPRHLMRRLRRLYNRMHPNLTELNILRGILASIDKHLPS
jgi:tRNA (cytidine32/uridine32-2'-O)-methyltransferase